jgi:phosphoenolpyruvate---glycerone phosphotransferase subunit DhaL
MTAAQWGPAELAGAFLRSCASVRAARAELTALDAAAGDGDLGESLAIGVAAIERDLGAAEPADVGDVLRRAGTSLSTAAPSTFGTLLGMALRDAGRALSDRTELSPVEVRLMLDAMVAGVQRRGEVQAGQRTVLDGLLASREALEGSGATGTAAALRAVARGARGGAAATASMRAQVGRAGWIGERAEGRPDAGAQAWAVFATGLAGEH